MVTTPTTPIIDIPKAIAARTKASTENGTMVDAVSEAPNRPSHPKVLTNSSSGIIASAIYFWRWLPISIFMVTRLPTGKVGPYELAKLVFPYIRLHDRRVLVGPRLGLDAAVVDYDDRVLVLSSDPITGALRDPGWLSVHINANDVATMGAEPKWFLANLFTPEGCSRKLIRSLIKRMTAACDELGISLVGGHTEVTPGLKRILISGAMIGEAPKDRFVTSAGAKPGNRILLTKGAAIEGTAILATDREAELTKILGRPLIARAKRFMDKISVVRDALTAVSAGGVTAMHDPTEGGLARGLNELADASHVGFKIKREAIPIASETVAICKYFDIDPLQTIGSGSLLITAPPRRARGILAALTDAGIQVAEIGKIVANRKVRLMDGKPLRLPAQDHLWRIFKR